MKISQPLALAFVLVFLIASSTILVIPVYGTSASENTWTTKAPMPTARGGLGVAVVDGKIYAIGGDTQKVIGGVSQGGGLIGANEVYDPTTNTWTTKASMPTPRAYFAIAVYQNKIFCIGGNGNNGADNPHTGVNEVYDPKTDSWETKAPMPTPRASLQGNVLNGKIYCIGGTGISGAAGVNEVYDPTSDTWTTKSPMPTVTDIYSPSAVFNGKIFVFCGFSYYTNEPVNFQKTQIYDPTTDNWSLGASPPKSVYGVAVVTTGIMAPERIYVLSNGGNQIYNPESNTWTLGANVPTNGQDFGAAVVNDKLYLIGGRVWAFPFFDVLFDLTPSAANDVYTPAGYGTPDPAYLLEHTLPKISIESPLNQTYNDSSVTITFTVNKNITSASYSLDGQQNVTITDNNTIANLPNGLHNITVYAQDMFENIGSSQTISFTIVKPEPHVFPVVPVAAASAIVVVLIVVAGLLVYHKKNKHNSVKKV